MEGLRVTSHGSRENHTARVKGRHGQGRETHGYALKGVDGV